MTDIFAALKAHFPKEAISWRAQNVTKAGDKALALAYIDARDVMNRLDDVCGPGNWSDGFVETAKGRVIATIKIRVGDEWISKSDGAGDTDIEGEKGGMSDSFKRAAVKWGIGRYLYDMPATWVPCESEEFQGKRRWKKWTVDPWTCVRNGPVEVAPPANTETISDEQFAVIVKLVETAKLTPKFICESYKIASLKELPARSYDALHKRLDQVIQDNSKEAA